MITLAILKENTRRHQYDDRVLSAMHRLADYYTRKNIKPSRDRLLKDLNRVLAYGVNRRMQPTGSFHFRDDLKGKESISYENQPRT